jgi:hypothetical protein
MEEPGPLAERIAGLRAEGFTAVKIGWGPFGRKDAATDEAIVRAAREAIGDGGLLLVDPGASDAFWPQGYAWALRTAAMLEAYGVGWFEEPLPPDALADFVALRRATGGADRRRRDADPAPKLHPLPPGRRLRRRPAGRDEGGRPERGAADRLAGGRVRGEAGPPRLEHRGRAGGRPPARLGAAADRPRRVHRRLALRRRPATASRGRSTPRGCWRSRSGRGWGWGWTGRRWRSTGTRRPGRSRVRRADPSA